MRTSVYVCVCVCICLGLLKTSDMIWTPYDWLNNYTAVTVMTAVVITDDGHGLSVKACCTV